MELRKTEWIRMEMSRVKREGEEQEGKGMGVECKEGQRREGNGKEGKGNGVKRREGKGREENEGKGSG